MFGCLSWWIDEPGRLACALCLLVFLSGCLWGVVVLVAVAGCVLLSVCFLMACQYYLIYITVSHRISRIFILRYRFQGRFAGSFSEGGGAKLIETRRHASEFI